MFNSYLSHLEKGQSIHLLRYVKKLLQNTVHIHNIWAGTNFSIGGSPTEHNPVVPSISPSFILQVLQDRLILWIRRVTQLKILALSVWHRLWERLVI